MCIYFVIFMGWNNVFNTGKTEETGNIDLLFNSCSGY